MTAKLPPRWVPINLMQLNATQLRHVQSYSKTFALQAVREALERAARTLHPELRSMVSRSDAAAAIRALLKEYE